MAFWGVEVKPNKPYTHPCSKTSGRLRISQATLGLGLSGKKSIVQCNVGDKSPVLLCCLLPEKSEYCHLELEFEEEDDVVFSVIGPRSVHLTGYYLSTIRRHPAFGDSSESYGEDIGHTDSENVKESSAEDDFEDSFINDGIVEYYQPSPSVSGEETKEELRNYRVDHEQKVGWRRRRLRKKLQISESEDDGIINKQEIPDGGLAAQTQGDDEDKIPDGDLAAQPQGDDEDKIPISSLIRSYKNLEQHKTTEDEVSKVVVDGLADHKAQNIDKLVGANGTAGLSSKSELVIPLASVVDSSNVDQQYEEELHVTKKEKKNKGSTNCHDSKTEPEIDESKFNGTDTHMADEQCCALPNDNALALAHASVVASDVEQQCKVEQNAVEKENKRTNEGCILSHGSVDKNKNGLCEAELQMDESKPNSVDTNMEHKQCSVPENSIVLAIRSASVDSPSGVEQQNKEEERKKKKADKGNTISHDLVDEKNISKAEHQNKEEAKKKKKEKKKADRGKTVSHDSVDEKNSSKAEHQLDESKRGDPEKDIFVPNEPQTANDKNVDGSVVPDSNERKSKRKRRKVEENKDTITMQKQAVSSKDGSMAMEIDKPNPSEATSGSNGVVIEELELGNPDGEVASTGKKLKIRYTGKLKEGGSVYETSIGHKPFRFRLGECVGVIDGLHLGVEGMRVGGKRRITVPPELGYGSEGCLDTVPPNAWLVLEVELLRVR